MSQGNPPICTGTIARVRGVMRSATESGSILPSAPTSANTGVAPTCRIVFTVEQKVMGVVMTSSPGPIPRPARARCKPAVAEFTARAEAEPT